MRENIRFYRPAVAAFLTMMAMALTSSTLSFFSAPVCEELGVGQGSFSLIFSLMTIGGALTNPMVGKRAGTKGVRLILLVCGLWGGGNLFLLSLANNLWMIYGAGFLLGLLGSSCLSLCGTVIVQKSFDARQASSLLGIVMSGSGVGGMIFNMIIPAVMEAASWRQAMQVMALSWLVLLLGAFVLLGREQPVQHYGSAAGIGLGMTREEALKSPQLILLAAVIIVITAACGIQQQQPSLLAGYGYDAGQVSLMLSVQTAVLALGKIGQGILYGRLGVRRGGCAMMIVFAAAFAVLLIPALAWPGLILMALGLGIYTTLLPLVTRQVFGTREYAAIWGLLATCGSVGTIVANPLWGMVYDLTGGYVPGLILLPVLLAAAAVVLNKLLQDRR